MRVVDRVKWLRRDDFSMFQSKNTSAELLLAQPELTVIYSPSLVTPQCVNQTGATQGPFMDVSMVEAVGEYTVTRSRVTYRRYQGLCITSTSDALFTDLK